MPDRREPVTNVRLIWGRFFDVVDHDTFDWDGFFRLQPKPEVFFHQVRQVAAAVLAD
jgi:hypothetical protein